MVDAGSLWKELLAAHKMHNVWLWLWLDMPRVTAHLVNAMIA
jgi:CTP:molybdopterin cytidylyltransferase MocA